MQLENSLLQKTLLQLNTESKFFHSVMIFWDFESIIYDHSLEQLIYLTSQLPVLVQLPQYQNYPLLSRTPQVSRPKQRTPQNTIFTEQLLVAVFVISHIQVNF